MDLKAVSNDFENMLRFELGNEQSESSRNFKTICSNLREIAKMVALDERDSNASLMESSEKLPIRKKKLDKNVRQVVRIPNSPSRIRGEKLKPSNKAPLVDPDSKDNHSPENKTAKIKRPRQSHHRLLLVSSEDDEEDPQVPFPMNTSMYERLWSRLSKRTKKRLLSPTEILHRILRPVHPQNKIRIQSLSPEDKLCTCIGCHHLEDGAGGWASVLANSWNVQNAYAKELKTIATLAIEVITETFILKPRDHTSYSDEPSFCTKSFERAMVVRRLLEFRITPLGDYQWYYAETLRIISCGIARHELATRLVEKGILDPISVEVEKNTSKLFRALNGLTVGGTSDDIEGQLSPFADMRSRLKKFEPDVKLGLIDSITWHELYVGSTKSFQRLGTKLHILCALALFKGRCVSLSGHASFPEDCYDYIVEMSDQLVGRSERIREWNYKEKDYNVRKKLGG